MITDLMQMYYDDSTTPNFNLNWFPEYGTSWYWYTNTGDYKIENHNDKIVVDVLVAGLNKEDIEAYLEDNILKVKSSKPGWNGNLNLEIPLSSYKIDTKKVTVKLVNGVLRVEFDVKDEKIKLKIE